MSPLSFHFHSLSVWLKVCQCLKWLKDRPTEFSGGRDSASSHSLRAPRAPGVYSKCFTPTVSVSAISILLTLQLRALGCREVNDLAESPRLMRAAPWLQPPVWLQGPVPTAWESREKNFYHNECQNKDNGRKPHLVDLSIAFFFFRNTQESCRFQLGITSSTIIIPPNFTLQLVPRY